MTAEKAPGQAGETTGGPAGPWPAGQGRQPGPPGRLVRYGIWLAVLTRCLGDRRFHATVITGVIGAYALAGLIKNNQARPMRRVARWYNMRGEVSKVTALHRAPRPVKPTLSSPRATAAAPPLSRAAGTTSSSPEPSSMPCSR